MYLFFDEGMNEAVERYNVYKEWKPLSTMIKGAAPGLLSLRRTKERIATQRKWS